MKIETILSNFYYLEDIIPSLKKLKNKLIILSVFITRKYNELSIFLKYFLKNRQLQKQRKSKSDGINVEHYAKTARVLHENRFGLNNSDYGAVKIDWDLFAMFRKKRNEQKEVVTNKASRIVSLRSTYVYDTQQRITY